MMLETDANRAMANKIREVLVREYGPSSREVGFFGQHTGRNAPGRGWASATLDGKPYLEAIKGS
jgi:hypothetical protein